jgi:hypothetical protein
LTLPSHPALPFPLPGSSPHLDLQVETTSLEQLGVARKLTIANSSTTLIADQANKDEIKARIAQIKKELSETDSGGRRCCCCACRLPPAVCADFGGGAGGGWRGAEAQVAY